VTDAPFPVRLVCPRCRVPGEVEAILETAADGERCPGCGADYPREQGIRRILPFEPERTEPTLDPASPAFREVTLEAIYAIAHYPDVEPEPAWIGPIRENLRIEETLLGWLDRHAAPDHVAPAALDIGCGPGRFTVALSGRFPGGAVGMDIRVPMLGLARRFGRGEGVTLPFRTEGARFEDLTIRPPGTAPGPVRFLAADVAAPPFEAEGFPLVSALSVLDVMPDPILCLGQADALVAPGGLLLLAQPWQWEPEVTPPAAWWSGPDATGPETLRTLLEGRSPVLPHLGYEILEEADGIPWWLPGHSRLLHRYSLHAVLARKLG
jgi:SAM-dependent methyltransferase